MNTISNLINNLTNNTKEETKDNCQNNITTNPNYTELPSLSQGYKFKEYQDTIFENIEKQINLKNTFNNLTTKQETNKEGFNVNDSNINTVREEYNKTLIEYKELLNSISETVSNNITRVSIKNSYINKYIRFKTGEIYYVTNKGVAKRINTTSILNSIAGKNGCPNINYTNITIPWSYKYNIPGEKIPTNPPLIVGTEMQQGESCGYEGSNVYVSSMINKPKSIYKGCYQDNANTPSMTFIGSTPTTSSTQSGTYSFEQCQKNAVDGGYNFFALQNTNQSNGLGYCAVSNNFTNSTKYGKSYKNIVLWSSNTAGEPVSYAILKNNGTLNVCDSSGKAYFTSPNGTECKIDTAYNYGTPIFGRDAPGNDLGYYPGQTVSSCKRICDSKPNCGGIVVSPGISNLACWPKSGNLTNYTNFSARVIYKKTSLKYNYSENDCKYFLNLQNDGNMCIYKGIPETKNTLKIWSPNTTGKQQLPNENYSVAKSKYGMTFLKNDQILNKGDWVVSADGTLLLIMQTDGNLVLYTFQSNCGTIPNNGNKYFGGNLANPIYDIGSRGIKSNMGSFGYVDPDSELHTYPSTNIKYSNKYSSILENTNIKGNDITGASFENCSDVKQCMTACNKLDNCSGFVYDTTGNTPVCNPKKNTSFYDSDFIESKMKSNTYVRDKTVIKPPIGINNVVNNIDSIRYDNYVKYKKNNLNFGLTSLNSVQQKQLEQLESRLEQLSEQLKGYTDNLYKLNSNLTVETDATTKQFTNHVKKITSINEKINAFGTNNNIDNILKQTKVTTLQENYSYMFWSTIAVVTVLVAINIKK